LILPVGIGFVIQVSFNLVLFIGIDYISASIGKWAKNQSSIRCSKLQRPGNVFAKDCVRAIFICVCSGETLVTGVQALSQPQAKTMQMLR